MQFKNATDFSYVSTATPLPIVLNGVTTNSNAAAGQVGEYITGSRAQASEVAITTATPADITSISLTAGDWDVSGQVVFHPDSTTAIVTQLAWISATSATLPGFDSMAESGSGTPYTSVGSLSSVQTPVVRISVASTTTIYLSAQSSFTVSTNAAFGYIRARRVR